MSAAICIDFNAISSAVMSVSDNALAAAKAYDPPEPIPTMPSSGSKTSPLPLNTKETSLSATIIMASKRRKYLSVRQSFANSTQARVNCPEYFSILVSKRSNNVNASAVDPANRQ